MLLVGPLSGSTFVRFACGILGGIVMPLFIWNDLQTVENHSVFLVISVAMLFVACLVGELLRTVSVFRCVRRSTNAGAAQCLVTSRKPWRRVAHKFTVQEVETWEPS